MDKKENYFENLVNSLNNLRVEGHFCDVTLMAGKKEIPAHRNVLATNDYFLAMFSSKMQESFNEKITMGDMDGNALEIIVTYIYTNVIVIDDSNVYELLAIADSILMLDVKDLCCDFLKNQLNPGNSVATLAWAEAYNCPDLTHAAEKFLVRHFCDVLEESQVDILSLSFETFKRVISKDYLNAEEDKILQCLVGWIEDDEKTRERHLLCLLQCLKFSLLSGAKVADIFMNETVLQRQEECACLLRDAAANDETSITRRTARKVIAITDGIGCEVYDITEERWLKLDKPYRSNTRNFFSRCKDEKLCAVRPVVREVFCCCPSKNMTCYIREKPGIESFEDVIMYDRCIYGIGMDSSNRTRVEVYNIDEDYGEWTTIGGRIEQASCMSLGVDSKGSLYAIGGWNQITKNYSPIIKKYDDRTNSWVLDGNLLIPRSSVGVGVFQNKIYTIGGMGVSLYKADGVVLKCAEVYDPETKLSSTIADTNVARSFPAVVAVQDFLYVIGGCYEEGDMLESVEVYSPKTDTWTVLSGGMSHCTSWYPTALVYNKCDLPEEYFTQ